MRLLPIPQCGHAMLAILPVVHGSCAKPLQLVGAGVLCC